MTPWYRRAKKENLRNQSEDLRKQLQLSVDRLDAYVAELAAEVERTEHQGATGEQRPDPR